MMWRHDSSPNSASDVIEDRRPPPPAAGMMTARYSCRTVLFLFLVLGAVVCGRAGWWGDDDDGHDHSHEEELSLGQNYVTCGSLLKLRHVSTSVRLHSHQVSYGSGSGQQSVTGIDSRTTPPGGGKGGGEGRTEGVCVCVCVCVPPPPTERGSCCSRTLNRGRP